MNLNVRIGGAHIEFEPNTYYASFSGELEASASPMWALVSHIKVGALPKMRFEVFLRQEWQSFFFC